MNNEIRFPDGMPDEEKQEYIEHIKRQKVRFDKLCEKYGYDYVTQHLMEDPL